MSREGEGDKILDKVLLVGADPDDPGQDFDPHPHSHSQHHPHPHPHDHHDHDHHDEGIPGHFPLEQSPQGEHDDNHDDVRRHEAIIATTKPTTELEIALTALIARKDAAIDKITSEVNKLRSFVQKRKQTYKRKRKDETAPVRALSGYNLFIKERFQELKSENEKALQSEDANDQMQRVPPSNLVAKTGNEWKALPPEVKAKYDERAKADKKRYEEQMAVYNQNPPQQKQNKKKTAYNIFFSAHVLRLKQTDTGVPSERGSVARLVGEAWKSLSAEEKQFYEREADKQNGMNPKEEEEEEEQGEDTTKVPQYYAPHAEMPHPAMHHMAHDPRTYHQYYPPHQNPYGHGHYDYSQHHQRHSSQRHYHF